MFFKELTNKDFFIMQQEGRNGKLYYTIRSNFDMKILEKKSFKRLFEAKNFFKEKLPNKTCYYNRMVNDPLYDINCTGSFLNIDEQSISKDEILQLFPFQLLLFIIPISSFIIL